MPTAIKLRTVLVPFTVIQINQFALNKFNRVETVVVTLIGSAYKDAIVIQTQELVIKSLRLMMGRKLISRYSAKVG